MTMEIVHVVPSIADEASGPSYTVPRLCEALILSGSNVRLAALDSGRRDHAPYVRSFPYGLGPRRLGTSPRMRAWLRDEAASGRADIIHNHSLWMMPNVYSGWACGEGRSRLVVSPRGTLSSWSLGRNALAKHLFWRLWQRPALRSAVCFHATADSEYEDIRRIGFRQPVCVLPNGIDIPFPAETTKGSRRRLLFLGRIHPKKGVDVLLRAWKALESRFPDWDLDVVGPDNGGHRAEMEKLSGSLGLKRAAFRGPLFGDEKLAAYRAASLFVLPTHSENFGMTVAEALAAGTPAVVSRGAPWAGLEKERAGWWIDIGLDPLIACLESALAHSPTRLEELGRAGRAWMSRDFAWDSIGARLNRTYRWLIEGGETPSWVRTD